MYVSSRYKDNAVHWMGAWPDNKVEVLTGQTPVGVTENGKCIQFSSTQWTFPDKYVTSKDIKTEIRNIDTIIFCTGYLPNTSFLEKELSQALDRDVELKLPVPKDWKMTHNELTEVLGDVEPGDVRWIESAVSYPGLYRGLDINNPNMMFITTNVDNPMTGIDVCSRWLLQYITGEIETVPSKDEMIRQNERDALILLDNPYWRYYMDKNYHDAINAQWGPESLEELFKEMEDKGVDIYARFLARLAQEAEYPVDYGSLEELSERSKTILSYDDLSYNHRAELTAKDAEGRRTFRDYTDGDKFRSFYTGAESVSLKHLWLDMDANDPSILES